MIYSLPNINSSRLGFESIAIVAREAKALRADRLDLDLSSCQVFDANMASALGTVLARIADNFNAIEVVNAPPEVGAVLRKSGFPYAHGYKPSNDQDAVILPFRRIKLSDEGRFADYLGRHLAANSVPGLMEGARRALRQCIFEVFQNAVVHSGSRLGVFVCGGLDTRIQCLDVTISDAGEGIRDNVRRYLERKVSSVASIRWALQQGHTTKTGPQPGGVGLKFLKDFVALNRGTLQIASRFGFYELKNGEHTFAKLAADLPGTSVNIQINTRDSIDYSLNARISPEDIL